jgi:hypothetical protein
MTSREYAVLLQQQASAAPSDEWRIIMFFCAALHGANHALYGVLRAPGTHGAHERALLTHATLAVFFAEYEQLRHLSEDARYRPHLHPLVPAKVAEAARLCGVFLAACGIP